MSERLGPMTVAAPLVLAGAVVLLAWSRRRDEQGLPPWSALRWRGLFLLWTAAVLAVVWVGSLVLG